MKQLIMICVTQYITYLYVLKFRKDSF